LAILAGGLLVAGLLSLAVDVSHALILGAIAVVIAEFARAGDPPDAHPFPGEPRAPRAGTRREVSDLTWSAFRRDGRMSDNITRRLRRLAERRLRDRGIGPADGERAAALLGADLVAGLNAPEPPYPRQFTRWLDRLERLDREEAR
jgi:hypothetical protein